MVYSVVIPVFNESLNIRPLYERLKSVMDKLAVSYELVFVDDGSKDDSYQVLKDIGISDKNVKVLSFTRNFGHHYAVVAGIDNAQGDYIITQDADLQNPPEEIPKLIKKIDEGFDMVSGCRIRRKDPLARKLCSVFINLIIWRKTGLRMKDYGSMHRVFRRSTAKKLAGEFKKNRGYITMLAANVTHNVAEIEVGHDERYAGESKYGLKKLFSAFFRILFCPEKYGDTKENIYIIGKKVEDGKEDIISC